MKWWDQNQRTLAPTGIDIQNRTFT